MTVSDTVREQVRQRAVFACEYCGLRESDVSGQLTIDHFQPRSKGGGDEFSNLIYSCTWCNQRKLDYWPQHENDPKLWNPRTSTIIEHLLLLEDGRLHPLTEVGVFTLQRLQLNRPALVAYRLRQRYLAEQDALLTYYRDLISLQSQLVTQLTVVVQEQHTLLAAQQFYLDLLLGKQK